MWVLGELDVRSSRQSSAPDNTNYRDLAIVRVRAAGSARAAAEARTVASAPGCSLRIYWGDEEAADVLGTYADVYLREEVQAEGVARDLGSHARFLDVLIGSASKATLVRPSGPPLVRGHADITRSRV
jgi:hypothetical protein